MQKPLHFLKTYWKESVCAPLFKLLEACFDLAVPLVIARIINVGIAGGDTGYIIRMCGLLVLLGFAGLAFSVTAQYFAAAAAVGFSTGLRHALFARIQSLSYADLDRVGSSTFITRMTSDVNQLQTGVNMVLRLFLRSPFIVFGAMIMAFSINVQSALIFAVVIPVLSVIVYGIMLLTMPLYRKVQGKLDRVLGISRENLNGVRVIRAFCREESETEAFRRENDSLNAQQKFVGKLSALMNPLTYVVVNLAVLALIWRGAVGVNAGNLRQGDVVALYNYMAQILVELIKLANLIVTITKAAACSKRLETVLNMSPSLCHSAGKAADSASVVTGQKVPAVEFRKVSLRYPGGGDDALTDISFRAEPGETVGIIGGTGSGKTSLINLIPHFYDATGGEVLLDGRNVLLWDDKALRAKIGLVPQKAVLFRGTIRENLLWGNPDATEDELCEALSAAQATDVVAKKEMGLDSVVEQGGRNFSGGQRQRLTIARALVRHPDILILDDSASALDYATDARLRQALRQLKKAPTVFIVSQRTASLAHADRILVLDDGHLCGIGRHEQLLETCPVYREIYDSQFAAEGAKS